MAYGIIEQLECCDKPLDAKRVATIFGLSVRTVYNLAEKGKLPCIALGNNLRFDPLTLSYLVRRQHPMFAAAVRDAAKKAPSVARDDG